jgi:integrase
MEGYMAKRKPGQFTDKEIKSMKPEAKEYVCREGQGFSIRVLPSGEKLWYYIYTFEGRKRFMKLGTGNYPDVSLASARELFDKAKVKVKNGLDPLAEKELAADARRNAFTVDDLIKEYISKYAEPTKKSWKDDERLLNKEISPLWGKRKAEDIKKRDAVLLLEAIVERGSPATSNQTLKIARKMFNFAIERDILQATPFLGVKAAAPDKRKTRVLEESEIKTLWTSLDSAFISDEIKRALKLILITAQRPGEVSGMHRKEIEGRWWTIPAGRAKNKNAHRVYLTDTALDLIGSLTITDKETGEEKDKGFVFPTPHLSKERPIDSHALPVAVRRNLVWPVTDKKGNQLFDKKGNTVTENKLGVDKFTPHDLRRTAATILAKEKILFEHRERVLNHTMGKLDEIYNQHDYDNEKQIALETLERKVNNIVSGSKKDNVIPLKRRA